MDNSAFYSTIATVNGVWISLLFSLGVALVTYILGRNIDYFTSMRKELDELLHAHRDLNSVSLLNKCIRIDDAEKAKVELAEKLKYIQEFFSRDMDNRTEIYHSEGGLIKWMGKQIKGIIECYPNPMNPELTFKYSEESGAPNKLYANWIEKYNLIIDYVELTKTLNLMLDANGIYLKIIVDEEKIIPDIKATMNILDKINNTKVNIQELQTDYNPIIQIKKKSRPILRIFAGILVSGFVIPIYMLMPYHFNILSESLVILLILSSTALLYGYSCWKIKQIMELILKQ